MCERAAQERRIAEFWNHASKDAPVWVTGVRGLLDEALIDEHAVVADIYFSMAVFCGLGHPLPGRAGDR